MVLAAKIVREELVIVALPEQAVQIIDQARQHGRVIIGGMIRVTGTSRNTLKEHLASLVEKRHLVRLSTGQGSWYPLPWPRTAFAIGSPRAFHTLLQGAEFFHALMPDSLRIDVEDIKPL
jgi:hypothetical protein